MGSQKQHLTQFFLSEKLVLYAKQLYIFVEKKSTLLNYDRHSPFSKKVQFYENMTTQLFFGQSAPLHPKQKQIFFFWQCHVKAEGRSISKHPVVIP